MLLFVFSSYTSFRQYLIGCYSSCQQIVALHYPPLTIVVQIPEALYLPATKTSIAEFRIHCPFLAILKTEHLLSATPAKAPLTIVDLTHLARGAAHLYPNAVLVNSITGTNDFLNTIHNLILYMLSLQADRQVYTYLLLPTNEDQCY